MSFRNWCIYSIVYIFRHFGPVVVSVFCANLLEAHVMMDQSWKEGEGTRKSEDIKIRR